MEKWAGHLICVIVYGKGITNWYKVHADKIQIQVSRLCVLCALWYPVLPSAGLHAFSVPHLLIYKLSTPQDCCED